jgi:hypothetical protein
MGIDNTFSGGLVHIWASENGGALCGHAEPRAIVTVKSVQALNQDALRLLCESCVGVSVARMNAN